MNIWNIVNVFVVCCSSEVKLLRNIEETSSLISLPTRGIYYIIHLLHNTVCTFYTDFEYSAERVTRKTIYKKRKRDTGDRTVLNWLYYYSFRDENTIIKKLRVGIHLITPRKHIGSRKSKPQNYNTKI